MSSVWTFLLIGYALTVLIETPILLVGLGRQHERKRRILAGLWLTACTYPMVILFFPQWLHPGTQRLSYLTVAEVFAPVAECLLFWLAFQPLVNARRDMLCITLANLASFGLGELALNLISQ